MTVFLTRGQANVIYISILFLALLGIYLAYIIVKGEKFGTDSVATMVTDLDDSKLALSSVIVFAAGSLGFALMNFGVTFKKKEKKKKN